MTPFVLFATLREQMASAPGSECAVTTLCNVFGALALFLMRSVLTQCCRPALPGTGEIGVRLALGAERGTPVRMAPGDAPRLVGSGMTLGGSEPVWWGTPGFCSMTFPRSIL